MLVADRRRFRRRRRVRDAVRVDRSLTPIPASRATPFLYTASSRHPSQT
jgi:hypothetical protein